MIYDSSWEKFGWQGLEFRAPADWNLGRVDGTYEKGYVRLDDTHIVRVEVEWRKLRGREMSVPINELVDRYLAGLKKKAKKTDIEFKVTRRAEILKEKSWLRQFDYEMFTWDADFRAFNIAIRFTHSQRVVLLRILSRFEENISDQIEKIFGSLRDSSGSDQALWSVYGLSFFMPCEYKLSGHELKSGHIQLQFKQGRNEFRIHRLSMARLLLKESPLEYWYQAFFKKTLRDFQIEIQAHEVHGYTGLQVVGRPRSRWRQLLRPLPFVNPRPRLYLDCRLWHRKDLDKIFIIEHMYRKREFDPDTVEAVVNGHFFQKTETKSGCDADISPNAK